MACLPGDYELAIASKIKMLFFRLIRKKNERVFRMLLCNSPENFLYKTVEPFRVRRKQQSGIDSNDHGGAKVSDGFVCYAVNSLPEPCKTGNRVLVFTALFYYCLVQAVVIHLYLKRSPKLCLMVYSYTTPTIRCKEKVAGQPSEFFLRNNPHSSSVGIKFDNNSAGKYFALSDSSFQHLLLIYHIENVDSSMTVTPAEAPLRQEKSRY